MLKPATACAGFVALNLRYSSRLAVAVGITIVLGGAVTCALAYLLADRIVRPVTERETRLARPRD